jgi:hypothetical protein
VTFYVITTFYSLLEVKIEAGSVSEVLMPTCKVATLCRNPQSRNINVRRHFNLICRGTLVEKRYVILTILDTLSKQ